MDHTSKGGLWSADGNLNPGHVSSDTRLVSVSGLPPSRTSQLVLCTCSGQTFTPLLSHSSQQHYEEGNAVPHLIPAHTEVQKAERLNCMPKMHNRGRGQVDHLAPRRLLPRLCFFDGVCSKLQLHNPSLWPCVPSFLGHRSDSLKEPSITTFLDYPLTQPPCSLLPSSALLSLPSCLLDTLSALSLCSDFHFTLSANLMSSAPPPRPLPWPVH